MIRILYFLIISGIVFGACVPRKKLVYLQHSDELKRVEDIPTDTVLRSHLMSVREYRIQPLDVLSISFESITSEEYDFFSKLTPETNQGGGVNQLLRGVMVDANGEIEYPVTGKIGIAGLTVFEAQNKIQGIANQYLKDAVVRIRLLNFRFTVLGEVNGEKVVNSYNTRINLMEAIGLAGGFSELADRSHVKVVRQKGNESEVFYVNLLEEQFIQSANYFVQQNDIILVSPLRQRTFRRYFASNLGLWTSAVSAILLIITIANK